MGDMLRRNWRLRLLAFVLALSVWSYFRVSSGIAGFRPAELRLTLPITLEDTPPGLRAYAQPRDVIVTVNGAARRDTTPRATVSVLARGVGSYRLPVVVRADDAILSLAPANVVVVIEKETP